MAAKVLIVEDDDASRVGLTQLLEQSGYDVVAASTFEEGRRLLVAENPDLLITDVRLGEFNGLQLIITRRPGLPAIVVTGFADRVIEEEARQLGAEYVLKPFLPSVFLRLVTKKLASQRQAPSQTARRWTRKHVSGGLPARIETSRARIVDVSYGGLRFELNENPAWTLPPSFEVSVPASDVAVHADLVWQSRTEEGVWLCGAALSQADPDAERAWTGLVDALS